MTATITRQMALYDHNQNSLAKKKTIFNTFEILYFIICIFLLGTGLVFLEQISSNFFNESEITFDNKVNIFLLILLALFFQLPSSLYIGALMGLDKQLSANLLISFAALARGTLAMLFLYFEPSLENFFYSQIIVNVIYLISLRITVFRNLKSSKLEKRFDIQVVKDNLSFTSNMALLSVLGVILINIDKLLVANLLSLKEVGIYTLAFNLSTLPIMLCQIVSVSTYPTIIKEVQNFQEFAFKEFYLSINSLMASLLIPLSLTLIFFNNHISFAWIGDIELSKTVFIYSIILIAAQTIQGSTMLAYYYALSREITRPQILIAIFSVIMLLAVMYFAIKSYGLYGASLTLFACILISYPFGVIYLNKNKENVSLYSYSVSPYFKTLLILLPIYYLMSLISVEPFNSRILNVFIIILTVSVGVFVAIFKNYKHLENYISALRKSISTIVLRN